MPRHRYVFEKYLTAPGIIGPASIATKRKLFTSRRMLLIFGADIRLV